MTSAGDVAISVVFSVHSSHDATVIFDGGRREFQCAVRTVMMNVARCSRWLGLFTLVAQAWNACAAQESLSFPALPYGGTPIDYWGRSDDAVQRLQQRLALGELTLQPEERFGLLPAVLAALQIDPSSQVLKWASGAPHREIGVDKPRAIYFRDDVAVAWHPGAKQLELAAQSPRKGTVFYTLTTDASGSLRWDRPQRCLACHIGPNTGTNVPGWQLHAGLARSEAAGSPWENLTAHSLAFTSRWRSVYLSCDAPGAARSLTNELPFVLHQDYPTRDADPAAVLVRDHWLMGMNLLTRWSYEHQLQQPRAATTDALVRYLVMSDEVALPKPLSQETAFVRWWQQQGPRDPQGRSLRELDLQTRTFRYAVSPLIMTDMVQSQPKELQRDLLDRITTALQRIADAPYHAETIAILRSIAPVDGTSRR